MLNTYSTRTRRVSKYLCRLLVGSSYRKNKYLMVHWLKPWSRNQETLRTRWSSHWCAAIRNPHESWGVGATERGWTVSEPGISIHARKNFCFWNLLFHCDMVWHFCARSYRWILEYRKILEMPEFRSMMSPGRIILISNDNIVCV